MFLYAVLEPAEEGSFFDHELSLSCRRFLAGRNIHQIGARELEPIEQLLQNHPVERGEILMEIMNETSNWHLELNIDDERIGHLVQEMQRTKKPLAVEFILATDPEKNIHLQTQTTELGFPCRDF